MSCCGVVGQSEMLIGIQPVEVSKGTEELTPSVLTLDFGFVPHIRGLDDRT